MSEKCPICFNSSQFSFESSYFNIWQCESKNCRHLFAIGTKNRQGVVVNRESQEPIYRERNKHLIDYWGGQVL